MQLPAGDRRAREEETEEGEAPAQRLLPWNVRPKFERHLLQSAGAGAVQSEGANEEPAEETRVNAP